MKTKKLLGIWMDHSIAHIMEVKDNSIHTTEIKSEIGGHEGHSLGKNENLIHNKQHALSTSYFKEIAHQIQGFDRVILFGPGDAKNELFNQLSKDTHFSKIEITVRPSDKLTENQRNAFVKDYFEITHPLGTH